MTRVPTDSRRSSAKLHIALPSTTNRHFSSGHQLPSTPCAASDNALRATTRFGQLLRRPVASPSPLTAAGAAGCSSDPLSLLSPPDGLPPRAVCRRGPSAAARRLPPRAVCCCGLAAAAGRLPPQAVGRRGLAAAVGRPPPLAGHHRGPSDCGWGLWSCGPSASGRRLSSLCLRHRAESQLRPFLNRCALPPTVLFSSFIATMAPSVSFRASRGLF